MDTQKPVWIIAKRDGFETSHGDWKISRYSSSIKAAKHAMELIIDETPIGKLPQLEIGIFRNMDGWEDRRPRYFKSFVKRSIQMARHSVGGWVNSVESDFSTPGIRAR